MARRNSPHPGPRYLTTFQVAKLLGVSAPAVVNWVDQGLLPAHRTPGGHRRITRDDLAVFARERGLPLSSHLGVHPGVHPGGGLRVLVVDDEVDFCDMVREYLLQKGGFQVEVATSGFAAGLTVARFGPDVILMDIRMPDVDGFDVLRRLRGSAETRHIPVIACTAWHDPDTLRRIRSATFDALLQKPFRLEDLVETLLRLGRPAASTDP
ncbi:MAG: response regulator [Deltaproteobacteria bacterium]|nr:response regulator [Deltaproteobacteria bacterium]